MEMSELSSPQDMPRHEPDSETIPAQISSVYYDADRYQKKTLQDIAAWSPEPRGVNFLLIRGPQPEQSQQLGGILGLHPLSVEDIMQTQSRNKLEEYPEYFLFIMRLPFLGKSGQVKSEQLSFVLQGNRLILFTESHKPDLSSLLDRLERGSILRTRDTDDLLAALLDLIVNQFFDIHDVLAGRLDRLEDQIVKDPQRRQLEEVHFLKKDLIHMRQVLWPLRESLSNLAKSYISKVDGDTIFYMRDVEDHVVQLMQLGETYQEIATSLVDSYLSSIGNRTNEVMKVLTIFSTIFIPLTFLAGVYGMNFKYMPELYQKWGYPMFWAICAVVLVLLIRYFKKKGWI